MGLKDSLGSLGSGKEKKEKKPKMPKEPKEKKEKIPKVKKLTKQKKAKAAKPMVSVDVGSKRVKVVSGQYKNNKVVIKSMGSYILPEKACDDGKISRLEDVIGTVQNAMREGDIVMKDGVCTIESTDILQRELVVPRVKEADMLSLVTYEIGQHLPIDINSYILQYKEIEAFDGDRDRQVRIMVGAMPKHMAADYMDMFDQLQINPVALNVNTDAIEKLLDLESRNNSEFQVNNIAVIDMGHSRFNVEFYQAGSYIFNRILEVGGHEIDDVIAKNLDSASGDVERIKIHNMTKISSIDLINVYGGSLDFADSSPDNEEMILRETTQVIENWAEEIDSVLKYYTSRGSDNTLDEILIYGGSSYILDIDKYFENRFQIKVRRVWNLNCLDIAPNVNVNEVPVYLNAIGALIRL